ncbi:anthocyanidin 3-O-glucosyltransferase 7 [Hevea brasiliensis]|nr:anthocyanidin 3-O-glucosyltransferase 7 [Hevea brasiliensis]
MHLSTLAHLHIPAMPPTTTEPHVVVFAFPFGTHAAPLFSVIHRLATFSPNTHFSFFNTSESNTSIFSASKYNTLPNIKVSDVWDGIPERYTFLGKPQEKIELFLEAAPVSFRKSVKAAVAETGRKVTCLLTDAFFWFAAEMAEEIRVDWVAFWTSSPAAVSSHFYTDFIRENFGAGDTVEKDQTLHLIPGFSKVQIRDLPEEVLLGNLESIFSLMLHKMGNMLPRAAAVFLNSFEELDPIIINDLNSKFKRFLCTGPFNLVSSPSQVPDTNGCIAWLDKQKPASVAYVSFGSVATPPPKELVALAEALEASKVAFLWSLKDSSHLPKGFLDRTKSHGIVLPWAPQVEILAHTAIGVFITHCGWNSVLESIVGGVPMICRPFFGDQKLNGRMVEDVWNIGLRVEGGVLTKNGVIDCLDQIFSQEKGKIRRENIKTLQELAKRATESNGSSSKNFIALADLVTNTGNYKN